LLNAQLFLNIIQVRRNKIGSAKIYILSAGKEIRECLHFVHI